VSDPASGLQDALNDLRTVVAGARFPLAVPSATQATDTAERAVKQLDDYVLPRLGRLDAPLLVVVGGSTGAGKSTLINSLVRAPVTAAGVLRPTTRAPILVSHPTDTTWFAERRVLPGLVRTTATRTDHGSLQVISAPALAPGLALLDAPDIDSVVDANRELATQLLAAADLWLFVTTAARYADAVPWQLLRTARDRGTVLTLVLDRVPPGADQEIADHLREMLAAQRLGEVDVYIIPEAALDGAGLLPEPVISPLAERLTTLAGDSAARADVIRTSLDGAIRSLLGNVDALARSADEQTTAWQRLDDAVTRAYADADAELDESLADGALLRGEVRARWQEFVGTGDLMRALHARIGRLRDRVLRTGRRSTNDDLRDALTSGVATLVEEHATTAGERVAREWSGTPAGEALLTPALAQPRPDLRDRCERLVRDWQRGVLDLVAQEGAKKRKVARVTAYSVNATGLLVMIAVFASTAFIPTGAEFAVAGGTSIAAQKLLEAVFGDEAMRQLARRARDDLMNRVRQLLEVEAARFGDVRASIDLDPTLPERLRRAQRTATERAAAARLGSPDASIEPAGAARAAEPATGEPAAPWEKLRKTATPTPPGRAGRPWWRRSPAEAEADADAGEAETAGQPHTTQGEPR
jgi:hypothetical protein